MNLAFEKGQRVIKGSKGRGEAGEVTGVVSNVPPRTAREKGVEYLVHGGGRWKSRRES